MKTKDEVRIIGRPEFYTVLYVAMKKAALELGYVFLFTKVSYKTPIKSGS